MYKIAGVEPEEREILFQNTASLKGMNAAIIEKDFWVSLTFAGLGKQKIVPWWQR